MLTEEDYVDSALASERRKGAAKPSQNHLQCRALRFARAGAGSLQASLLQVAIIFFRRTSAPSAELLMAATSSWHANSAGLSPHLSTEKARLPLQALQTSPNHSVLRRVTNTKHPTRPAVMIVIETPTRSASTYCDAVGKLCATFCCYMGRKGKENETGQGGEVDSQPQDMPAHECARKFACVVSAGAANPVDISW